MCLYRSPHTTYWQTEPIKISVPQQQHESNFFFYSWKASISGGVRMFLKSRRRNWDPRWAQMGVTPQKEGNDGNSGAGYRSVLFSRGPVCTLNHFRLPQSVPCPLARHDDPHFLSTHDWPGVRVERERERQKENRSRAAAAAAQGILSCALLHF